MEADLREALATGRLVVPGAERSPTTPRESSRAPLRTHSAGEGDSLLVFAQGSEASRPASVTFRVVQDGQGRRCIFLDRQAGNACTVHGQLGASRQAAACRLFPRVAVAAPDAVSLTLSHYCPAAADLLFADSMPLEIVEDPAAFPGGVDYEGLDATRSLGPLLRPGVLLGWQGLRLWEEHVVHILALEGSAERAVATISALAESLRRWEPVEGEFLPFLAETLRGVRQGVQGCGSGAAPNASGVAEAIPPPHDDLAIWRWVAATVPEGHPLPEEPWTEADAARAVSLVDATWTRYTQPVRRWLAARAFASWLALQGDGLRTFAVGLRVGLGVLRAEAGRGCLAVGRRLDTELLREAIRRADLLLVHLADPVALARRLSLVER